MNNRFARDKDKMPNGISLLISILVRYPEIGTINFNPRAHTLKFTFLLTENPAPAAFQRFAANVTLSLEVMGQMENKPVQTIALERNDFADITQIELTRDVDTLTQEEISLIIQLFRQEFTDALVTDYNDSLLEEDLAVQEELIDNMLEDLRGTKNDKNFYAFREEGRVMVFNK